MLRYPAFDCAISWPRRRRSNDHAASNCRQKRSVAAFHGSEMVFACGATAQARKKSCHEVKIRSHHQRSFCWHQIRVPGLTCSRDGGRIGDVAEMTLSDYL